MLLLSNSYKNVMNILKQDEHNSPLSNFIIGKKSDKNSLNSLPVIDRSCQVLSLTLVISNFQIERKKKIGILGKIVKK